MKRFFAFVVAALVCVALVIPAAAEEDAVPPETEEVVETNEVQETEKKEIAVDDAKAVIDEIWNYALPIAGGVTVGGVIAFFFVLLGKKWLAKIQNKLNLEELFAKVEEKAEQAGIEKIKITAFKQSIEPLVMSELEKVYESVNAKCEQKLAEMGDKYNNIIAILEGLAAYFDDSIAVSDKDKENLKEIIANAKTGALEPQEIEVEQVMPETEKGAENAKKSGVVR